MTTKIDYYGQLACLIGSLEGDEGVDVAPAEDGEERNDYYDYD